MAGVNVIYW